MPPFLVGHHRAATTDHYAEIAGLYTFQSETLSSLGGNCIGQAAKDLLKKDLLKTKIPQEKIS